MVAFDVPWPPSTGHRQRLSAHVAALQELGEIDLFGIVPAGRAESCDVPPDAGLARVEAARERSPQPSPLLKAVGGTSLERPARFAELGGQRLARAARTRLPVGVAPANVHKLRQAFRRFARPPYDLVWFSRAEPYLQLGRPRVGPTVVDFEDLEHVKLQAMRAAILEQRPSGLSQGLRRRIRAEVTAVEARRWRRAIEGVARSADHLTACSELDARRLGAYHVTVVPNGYDAPERPLGRLDVGSPPTVLLQGNLWYGPNLEAARILVTDIGPRLRALVPDVRIRLVGNRPPAVAALADPPGVTVVGVVPDMAPELAGADLIATPIPYGSGTRTKIVEAFAHRVPVVSSTVGAEGLDAEDGRHLLLADDPDSFAGACARLLADIELRRRLTEAARRLFDERFESSQVRRAVIAAAVATSA